MAKDKRWLQLAMNIDNRIKQGMSPFLCTEAKALGWLDIADYIHNMLHEVSGRAEDQRHEIVTFLSCMEEDDYDDVDAIRVIFCLFMYEASDDLL